MCLVLPEGYREPETALAHCSSILQGHGFSGARGGHTYTVVLANMDPAQQPPPKAGLVWSGVQGQNIQKVVGSEPSIPAPNHPAILTPGGKKDPSHKPDEKNTVFHPSTNELTIVQEQCAAGSKHSLLQTSSGAITGHPRLCLSEHSGLHYLLLP